MQDFIHQQYGSWKQKICQRKTGFLSNCQAVSLRLIKVLRPNTWLVCRETEKKGRVDCRCVWEFRMLVVCYVATPLADVCLGGYKHGAREIESWHTHSGCESVVQNKLIHWFDLITESMMFSSLDVWRWCIEIALDDLMIDHRWFMDVHESRVRRGFGSMIGTGNW